MEPSLVYLDTNVYNQLVDRLTPEEVRGLRVALSKQSLEQPVLSPVVILEIALTSDELRRERLVYLVQHLCSPRLLAEPEELILGFIVSEVPGVELQHLVPPDSYCRTHFQTVWDDVRADPRRTFIVPREIRAGLRLLKKAYKLLQAFTERPDAHTLPDVRGIEGMADAERLIRRSIVEARTNERAASHAERVRYAGWLMSAALVGSRSSVFPELIDPLWSALGIEGVKNKLDYIFKHLPFLSTRGPIFTMGAWLASTPADDGNLLDGLHLMYLPYVTTFLTLDKQIQNFVKLLRTNTSAAKVMDAQAYIDRVVAAASING